MLGIDRHLNIDKIKKRNLILHLITMWTHEVIQLVISHLRDEVIEIERINVDMIGPAQNCL